MLFHNEIHTSLTQLTGIILLTRQYIMVMVLKRYLMTSKDMNSSSEICMNGNIIIIQTYIFEFINSIKVV